MTQDPVAELFTLQGGAPSAPAPAANAAAEADPFGFAEFSDSTAPPVAAAAPVRIGWHALLSQQLSSYAAAHESSRSATLAHPHRQRRPQADMNALNSLPCVTSAAAESRMNARMCLKATAMLSQAAGPTGVGSKPALPEDLFSMDPVPMQAPPAQQPGMMIEQVLQQRHQQQQQMLGQLPGQQQFGGTLMPGLVPQGGYLGQQPLPTQQQQQYFQAQVPQQQQQQQYFMQPQAQPAFGAMQAAATNGSGLQGPQAGQPGAGGAAAQGRTLSGKPLAQSGAPDPFAGLGF